MGIAKTILTVVYFIIAIAMIILALIQTKEDGGLSSTITGSSTNNFYEKNKGRTKEGKQKRWTIILAILFAILSWFGFIGFPNVKDITFGYIPALNSILFFIFASLFS